MHTTTQIAQTESFTAPRIAKNVARKMLRRVCFQLFGTCSGSYSEVAIRLRSIDLTNQYADTRTYRERLAVGVLECAALGWAHAATTGQPPHRITIPGNRAERAVYAAAIRHGAKVAMGYRTLTVLH